MSTRFYCPPSCVLSASCDVISGLMQINREMWTCVFLCWWEHAVVLINIRRWRGAIVSREEGISEIKRWRISLWKWRERRLHRAWHVLSVISCWKMPLPYRNVFIRVSLSMFLLRISFVSIFFLYFQNFHTFDSSCILRRWLSGWVSFFFQAFSLSWFGLVCLYFDVVVS